MQMLRSLQHAEYTPDNIGHFGLALEAYRRDEISRGKLRELVARIDRLRKPHSIISSNTSGLPISQIASQASEDFQKHFLGTHFFNPPYLMKLLEVIPTTETDPAVLASLIDFAARRLRRNPRYAVLIVLTRWQAVHLLPAVWFYRILGVHGMSMLIFFIIFFEMAVLYFAGSTLVDRSTSAEMCGSSDLSSSPTSGSSSFAAATSHTLTRLSGPATARRVV